MAMLVLALINALVVCKKDPDNIIVKSSGLAQEPMDQKTCTRRAGAGFPQV